MIRTTCEAYPAARGAHASHRLSRACAGVCTGCSERPITPDDVEKKLKALTSERSALKTWRELAVVDVAEGEERSMPPFLKLVSVDGRDTVSFLSLSLQYVFLIDVLAEECGSSLEQFQKCINSPKSAAALQTRNRRGCPATAMLMVSRGLSHSLLCRYTRALRFGAGRLAEKISRKLPDWVFTQLTPTGFETLLLMLLPEGQYIGAVRMRSFCLPVRDRRSNAGAESPYPRCGAALRAAALLTFRGRSSVGAGRLMQRARAQADDAADRVDQQSTLPHQGPQP
jgi:hypothetical protein